MFVITGASDGLGLEVAKLLLSQRKKVVSLSRSEPLVEGVQWIKTDLTDEASIEAAAKQVNAMDDKLEVLVNCAGVLSFEPIENVSFAELERVFHTNVIGAILLTSRLMERIKKDAADVVNVSSTVGTKAYKDQAAYGSSKWAMRGFSANLDVEFAGTPCRVISFCVGGFRSKIATKVTGKPMADPENWMDPVDVAGLLVQLVALPKNMQVSEIVFHRKPVSI